MILSMCLFSFLVLIIFSFTLGMGLVNLKEVIPGILWVVFIFSGLMGLSRSFGAERDKGTIQGLLLCPVSRWEIFLAKMTATFIFTVIMEIFTLSIFIILYNEFTAISPPVGIYYSFGNHRFLYHRHNLFSHVSNDKVKRCDTFNTCFSNIRAVDYCCSEGNRDNFKWKINPSYLSMAKDFDRF
jgi:hypothetical protein